ncbi:poly(A) RNA polymerase, mitochondrial-like [Uranotaenia lowii]|uniref:poly(A) RNA polymerase, mitochondrial-like n=1 Tax=Uranotaenia lowii TaxID=190385 RepID=UPI0024792006|nr:poly(A) RNA polymerase, mitochondrial-like [Uranotaenia lowii]XP_055606238.1 poly(A) RNA polymerase, mitochondrial-like [Uranotaenia lowii]
MYRLYLAGWQSYQHRIGAGVGNLQALRKVLSAQHPQTGFKQVCPGFNSNAQMRSVHGGVHTFESMLVGRKSEARRSILVQVSSERSFSELDAYCAQFGTVTSSHHYRVGGTCSGYGDDEADCHYIVVEFEKPESADAAIRSAVFNEEKPGVRARSIFLWFRAGPRAKLQVASGKSKSTNESKLTNVDASRTIDDKELRNLLLSAENAEDQIKILHQATCLNDVGKRLRFLAVRQMETSLQGMFPQAVAYPFGSSVNGFGKMGCDLDLILDLDSESSLVQNSNSRLVFHTKASNSNERTQVQRYLESIGDVLQLFLPGVNSVRRILKARVPIIKYHHEHLDLEIDLTMNNMTGVYMSELLYLFGQIDPRVQPLTFCVRRWAQSVGLTNHAPGYWITNFSLTMLVMYFLQQLQEPILPPINKLIQSASKTDLRITENHISCSFLRDVQKLNFSTKNTTPLDELLLQFFEFYSHFDFNQRAISLNIGSHILKPDHSPMYIVNPLETVLNVSKNVNLEETELFRIQVRNALWLLDTHEKSTRTSGEDWGLISLFGNKIKDRITPQMFFTKRLVNVKDILDDAGGDNDSAPVEYKNQTVKSQISHIQKSTREEISKLGGGKNGPPSSFANGGPMKMKRNAKRR